MKTYLEREDGLYVKRHQEWVYIGHDLQSPEDSSEEIVLVDDLDELSLVFAEIRADVAREKALAAEAEKVSEWNKGQGIKDKATYALGQK